MPEQPFACLRHEWSIPDDVTYLNHGSFGPSPRVVQAERTRWYQRLEAQPMDFYLRTLDDALDEARRALADLVGAEPDQLAFVENATTAMNVVARTLAATLRAGDEVLLSDHEYGAVKRIWQKTCEPLGARVVEASWPLRPQRQEELVDALLDRVTPRTRLIVVSHVTSPTALIVPVERICREASQRGVPVCVDGPHALATLPLRLRQLGCAFYTASCHKWLCAPFGSGFLYVADEFRQQVRPAVVSWGQNLAGRPPRWLDEFDWVGTRDPSPYLAVPAAIRFLADYGLQRFRQDTHKLARLARQLVSEAAGAEPLVPDSPQWYGPMLSFALPASQVQPQPGLHDPLQEALWQRFRIEVPVWTWRQTRLLRVSCHLYNSVDDLQRLADALSVLSRDL